MSWQRQQILLKYFFTPQVSEMSNYYLSPLPLGWYFKVTKEEEGEVGQL